MVFPVMETPDIELSAYLYEEYGGVPPDVELVKVTPCPVSIALVVGVREIVGSELTVITLFALRPVPPRLSVTVSRTL